MSCYQCPPPVKISSVLSLIEEHLSVIIEYECIDSCIEIRSGHRYDIHIKYLGDRYIFDDYKQKHVYLLLHNESSIYDIFFTFFCNITMRLGISIIMLFLLFFWDITYALSCAPTCSNSDTVLMIDSYMLIWIILLYLIIFILSIRWLYKQKTSYKNLMSAILVSILSYGYAYALEYYYDPTDEWNIHWSCPEIDCLSPFALGVKQLWGNILIFFVCIFVCWNLLHKFTYRRSALVSVILFSCINIYMLGMNGYNIFNSPNMMFAIYYILVFLAILAVWVLYVLVYMKSNSLNKKNLPK